MTNGKLASALAGKKQLSEDRGGTLAPREGPGAARHAVAGGHPRPVRTYLSNDLYGGFTILAIYYLGEHLLEIPKNAWTVSISAKLRHSLNVCSQNQPFFFAKIVNCQDNKTSI